MPRPVPVHDARRPDRDVAGPAGGSVARRIGEGNTKMDVRRDAARFRDIPALVPPPPELDVRSTHVGGAPALQTSWLRVAVGIGLVVLVALSVAMAVSLERGRRIAAGPSAGSWLGYPPHFGLAGPSRVGPSAGPIGIGAGYPPHYGLAGPSRVGPSAGPIGIGAGYPPHYGLAGPSRVDDGS